MKSTYELEQEIVRLRALLDNIWELGINEFNFDYDLYVVEPSKDDLEKMEKFLREEGEI